jgi:hypothetical protein
MLLKFSFIFKSIFKTSMNVLHLHVRMVEHVTIKWQGIDAVVLLVGLIPRVAQVMYSSSIAIYVVLYCLSCEL